MAQVPLLDAYSTSHMDIYLNLTGGDDKAGTEAERGFSGSSSPVLLPVPEQYDVRYPYSICETDCKVLYFSNRSPGWTHLAASPPLCNG